jgi:hypothetical protein
MGRWLEVELCVPYMHGAFSPSFGWVGYHAGVDFHTCMCSHRMVDPTSHQCLMSVHKAASIPTGQGFSKALLICLSLTEVELQLTVRERPLRLPGSVADTNGRR